MSPRTRARGPSVLGCRSRPRESCDRWNRPASPVVVQGVGKRRGAAALLAACVVLTGCASDPGDEMTTSSPVAQAPTNPWDLPLEQRPPLFDPCEEIPVEAVEEALGGPVEPVPELTKFDPGELDTCGWSSDKVLLDVLATWKSFDDYQVNPTGEIGELRHGIRGRNALRMTDRVDDPLTCRHLFFTGYGTVAISLSLTTALESFGGERFSRVCEVLQQVSGSIVEFVPEGDFR